MSELKNLLYREPEREVKSDFYDFKNTVALCLVSLLSARRAWAELLGDVLAKLKCA